MKKITTFLIALIITVSSSLHAQSLAFDKGKTVVTIGYGAPNLARVGLRVIYGLYPGYSVKGFGPILVKGDYGILKQLGVGAVIGYSSTSLNYLASSEYYDNNNNHYVDYTYQETLKWTSLSLGAHANYHFVTKEKLDVYVGAGLGYSLNNITYSNNDPYQYHVNYTTYQPNAVYYAVTIGLRYYFTPNIGIYAEGGIDKGALFQGGLAIKF